MNKFEGHPPFSSELVDDELFGQDSAEGKLKVLEDDPDIVVRIDTRANAEEHSVIAKRLYEEFVEKCPAIVLPKNQFVRGEQAGESVLYTLVKRVEGRGILDELAHHPSPGFLQALNQLFSILPAYYVEKYKNGEFALSDITLLKQYVYGHMAGEPQQVERLYLVDLDPLYNTVVADAKRQPGPHRIQPGGEEELYGYLQAILGQIHLFDEYLKNLPTVLSSFQKTLRDVRADYPEALYHELDLLEQSLRKLEVTP